MVRLMSDYLAHARGLVKFIAAEDAHGQWCQPNNYSNQLILFNLSGIAKA